MGHAANTPFRTAPLRPDGLPGRDVRLEVIARWGDEVLAVTHLGPGERFALVSRANGHAPGTHALVHPAVDDGAWTFAEHAPDGRCTAWRRAGDGAPGEPVALDDGDAFGERVGDVCLVARRMRTTDDAAPREFIGARTRAVVALAVGLLALLVAAAASLRVPPFGERWAGEDRAARDAPVLRALMARWPARSVTQPPVAYVRPHRPRYVLGNRYRIRENDHPSLLSRQQARDRVQNRGIFAALGPDPMFAWAGCYPLPEHATYGDVDYDHGLGDRVWTLAYHRLGHVSGQLRGRVSADGRLYALRVTAGDRSLRRLFREMGAWRLHHAGRDHAFECDFRL